MSATQVALAGISLPSALASAFGADLTDELSAGVSAGFAVLSYRGKVWRVKYKSNETVVMNSEGDPAASVTIIMLKSNPNLSKIYYAEAYEEGDDAAPACSSTNGDKPDSGVQAAQAAQCDVCPQNVWGSKITPQGTETKACADSRRVVVVPSQDIRNESFGGPMLLRVPAASLGELASYADVLKSNNVPYYGVVTKVSFDPEASYPKLKFTPVRGITEDEVEAILELRDGSAASRIISEAVDVTPAAQPATKIAPTEEVEEPTAVVKPKVDPAIAAAAAADKAAADKAAKAAAKAAKAAATKAAKAAKAGAGGTFGGAPAATVAAPEVVEEPPIAGPDDGGDFDIDAMVGSILNPDG